MGHRSHERRASGHDCGNCLDGLIKARRHEDMAVVGEVTRPGSGLYNREEGS